ncbi:MAG TPA: ABC transporter ATP-binding protein [Petrotogaceae bacterium]|jgi:oligopeptide/dipeptide ABC transporter ATP-binding protein|nr:ABC transporter ATP-binding protein [Petrotogaceae bacterium]HQF34087.1 ABC transporter ATP-binding protein [Petrotogaceae bacterium]
MNEKLFEIKDLSISFKKKDEHFFAVKSVDFDIHKGEIVGLVGESGCGKTLTGLSIIGLTPGDAVISGQINFKGMNLLSKNKEERRSTRGKSISMIFQEPMTSLNPLMKVGDQIRETLLINMRIDKLQAKQKVYEIMKSVGFADVCNLYKKYPHELSGGMRQRVVICIAIACNPDLIIADEPTTALDVTVQAQILELLKKINLETNSSILFISHDFGVIKEMCSQVIVMYAGYIVEKSCIERIFSNPIHPYTQALLKCIPAPEKKGNPLFSIKGKVPSIYDNSEGCPFFNRCSYALERCRKELPELREYEPEHLTRCFYAEEKNGKTDS